MKPNPSGVFRGFVPLLIYITVLPGCTSSRKISITQGTSILPVATTTRPGLQYNLYLLPADSVSVPYTRFSIRVLSTTDNFSPLRRLCRNLQEYNTYYEYLLNGAAQDLLLVDRGQILYPVSYSFENNYNAFPFETINVGYRYGRQPRRPKKRDLKMIYTDRVFAQDTIVFNLNQTNL